MYTPAQRLRTWGAAAALVLAATVIAMPALVANNPRHAAYSTDASRVFWFVQTSDTHIGASGSTDANNLRWLLTTARGVINPAFIVVTGDLTDSTNGNFLGYPNGPYQAEWDEYKGILASSGVTASDYFDLPGNHDAYNDASFAYYRANSLQGRATGSMQVSWTRDFPFGSYHFLGVNTADNTGAGFSLLSPYGDHAGLDGGELAFVQNDLVDHAGANLTFVFGHHPVTATGSADDTYLYYGHQEFIAALDSNTASAYGYGHTHATSTTQFTGDSYTGTMANGGIRYVNVSSLGKSSSGQYTVFAVDNDGVSAVPASVGTWPVVLITTPVNKFTGSVANPYAYTVPNSATNPIRALVFDAGTVGSVSFRVDGASVWQAMSRVAGSAALWTGTWDATGAAAGQHSIEVRAVGTSTRSQVISVDLVATGNQPPVAVPDQYSVAQGGSLAVSAPGVLGNDTDLNGDTLSAAVVASPTHGTLTLNANGSFTYVPLPAYSGSDSFTYAASDGHATSNTATASITVTAAPMPDTITAKATWSTRTTKLSVTATSSQQPNVTLTVLGVGQMTWSSKAKTYSLTKTVAPKPGTVTVVSNINGSTTVGVTTTK